MLSLKYIAMLLQRNPNIQGAEGSEYRLFTVALMLGMIYWGQGGGGGGDKDEG